MKALLKWKEGMVFDVQAGGNTISIDAKSPIGKGSAQTPKELVIDGLGGCTAMDVVALLKKYKQSFEKFEVEVQVEKSKGHPIVFTEAQITFMVEGNVDADKLLEAVKLSQTQFCGVSAMLSKAFPIRYKVMLNGEEIGTGEACFQN